MRGSVSPGSLAAMQTFQSLQRIDVDRHPESLREALQGHKAVWVRNDDPHEDDAARQRRCDRLLETLGEVVPTDEDVLTGQPTGARWIDIRYDPAIPMRYRTAPVAQPLHTDYSYVDLPGNVQFIACWRAAPLGGATTLIDADQIVELLLMAGERRLLDQLQTLEVSFAKPPRHRRQPILRREPDGLWHFNWNVFCVAEDAHPEERTLVQEFHRFLETRVVPSGLLRACPLAPGDWLVFHDELILHGRQSYFARQAGDRWLRKATVLPGFSLAARA